MRASGQALSSEEVLARRHVLVRRIGSVVFVVFLGLAVVPITFTEVVSGQRDFRWLSVLAVALVLVALWPLAKDQEAWLRRGGYAAALVWLTICVVIPFHPRVRFARDVELITVGMDRAEVDLLMGEHVEGLHGGTLQLLEPGKTFFEDVGGDDRCLVVWRDGKVASVQYHPD